MEKPLEGFLCLKCGRIFQDKDVNEISALLREKKDEYFCPDCGSQLKRVVVVDEEVLSKLTSFICDGCEEDEEAKFDCPVLEHLPEYAKCLIFRKTAEEYTP